MGGHRQGHHATARRVAARQVRVRLAGGRGYAVRIAEHGFDQLAEVLAPYARAASRLVVIADANAWRLHGAALRSALAGLRGGAGVLVIRVPAGESSKSIEACSTVYDRLIRSRVDRAALLLAFGGGVTGDLAGFVAATYLRGIDFVQVPTTLLAQVDSSVGGKTGINHARGKNLVGAFHQPRAVFAAMNALATLPAREFASGLAEVVKYGVIRDGALFRRLEREAPAVRDRDPALLAWLVQRSVATKARVVEGDEREAGDRALLNLGHTLGHAIEQSSGFSGWTHGEAVAAGMAAAVRVSRAHGWISARAGARVEALLEELGLPTSAPGLSARRARAAMARDKKVRDGRIRFVAPTGIGRAELRWMPVDEVAEELVEAAAA